MMKILLLNPTIKSGEAILRSERCQGKLLVGLWPPIGLAYVAGLLRVNGFDQVQIMDAVMDQCSFTAMIDRIAEYAPDFILVQNTTPTVKDDLEMAQLIKSKLPQVVFAFYGLHATVRPEDILGKDVIFCLRNEPEYTTLELLQWLGQKSGDSKLLRAIQGLSFYEDGGIVHNPQRGPITDLDALPFPARDLLANNKYIVPTTLEPFTLIKTSRGCPYRCSYCTAPAYYGLKWRSRSAENVVAEIKECVQKYGIVNYSFSSDTFNVTEEHVTGICRSIIDSGLKIKWMCNSRVDNFSLAAAREMKKAGCWLIAFGIESGSQFVLDQAHKQTTVAQAYQAIDICRQIGIQSLAYFMFGLPGETRDTIQETFAFIKKADPDYAHFYAATPFPGTDFYALAEKEGYLNTKDWTRYFHGMSDVVDYPGLSAREINLVAKKAYRVFYFRPAKIWQELKRLGSWKQLKGSAMTFLNMVKTWMMRK